MIFNNIHGILLDIEGTTSSISFVYDVMFPFVRANVSNYVSENWSEADLQECVGLLASDLDKGSADQWFFGLDAEAQQAEVVNGVIGLMDADVKATGLKQLQGLIWKDGFHSGQMVAHLYDEVAGCIRDWTKAGIDVRIYSSGSIGAQKLFFGHTVAGDLLDQIKGHYDTTTGPKQEAESYRQIATEFDCQPGEILFISDVIGELSAANAAGMQSALSLRPGNKPIDDGHGFETITSFDQIQFS